MRPSAAEIVATAAFVCVCALGSPAVAADPAPLSGDAIFQKILPSVVWIHGKNETQTWTGSGWIVDRGRRLVVTNHHVVQNVDEVKVFFPAYEEGSLVTDKTRYARDFGSQTAKVIDSNPEKDLAIIQIESLPEDAVPLRLADGEPHPGASVHSVGNPGASRALWVYTSGTVRSVVEDDVRAPDQKIHARIVVTQSPINGGDSGGPVVDQYGRVVAVVSSVRTDASLVSSCISVEEVRKYVAEIGRLTSPRLPSDYRLLAERQLQRKKFPAAVASAQKALEAAPKDPAAMLILGRSELGLKNFTKAAGVFTQVVQLQPKNHQAYSYRALARSNSGDPRSAGSDFDQAVALAPDDASLRAQRARFFSEQGQDAKALDDWEKVLEVEAENLDARVERARVFDRLGRSEEGLKEIELAVAKLPDNAFLLSIRGELAYHVRRWADARKDFDKAVQLREDMVYPRLARGEFYFYVGLYDAAVDDFTEALKREPENVFAILMRAVCHREAGRATLGQQDLERLSAKGVRSPLVQRENAEQLRIRGRMDDAFREVDAALAADPKSALAWVTKGRLHYVRGERPAAQTALESALKVLNKRNSYQVLETSHLSWLLDHDRDAATLVGEMYNSGLKTSPYGLMFARALDGDGQTKVALQVLDQILDAAPTLEEGLLLRAKVQRGFNKLPEALKDYNSVLSRNARSYGALVGRGTLLRTSGKFAEAIEDLDNALRVIEDGPDALLQRGMTFAADAKFDRAAEDFRKIVSRTPANISAQVELCKALHAARKYDEAVGAATAALTAFPKAPVLLLLRARANNLQNKNEATVEDCDEIISIAARVKNDVLSEAYEIRGMVRFREDKLPAAREDFTKAIEADGANFWAYFSRGRIGLREDQASQAWRDFNRSLEIQPKFALGFMFRARCNALLGRTTEAESDMAAAEKLDPNLSKNRVEVLRPASR